MPMAPERKAPAGCVRDDRLEISIEFAATLDQVRSTCRPKKTPGGDAKPVIRMTHACGGFSQLRPPHWEAALIDEEAFMVNLFSARRGATLRGAVGAFRGLPAFAFSAGAGSAQEAASDKAKPVIVLVHGAWADASSWNGVIGQLLSAGYTVYAPPNPLRGLATDSATIATFVKSIPGPVILVGHSYGGAVISVASPGEPNVKALVYVNAFAPDEGESPLSLLLPTRRRPKTSSPSFRLRRAATPMFTSPKNTTVPSSPRTFRWRRPRSWRLRSARSPTARSTRRRRQPKAGRRSRPGMSSATPTWSFRRPCR